VFQPKTVLLVSAVAFGILFAPVAAQAASHAASKSTPISQVNVGFHRDDSSDSNEIEGSDDSEDHYIPPVVIVPGDRVPSTTGGTTQIPKPSKKPSTSTSTGTGITGTKAALSGTSAGTNPTVDPTGDLMVVCANDPGTNTPLKGFRPHQSNPVEIDKVRVTHGTPAEEFLNIAYFALGFLAVSAAGLAGYTAVRTFQLRREGKYDYFYSDK